MTSRFMMTDCTALRVEGLEPRVVLSSIAGVGADQDGYFYFFRGEYNERSGEYAGEWQGESFAYGPDGGTSGAVGVEINDAFGTFELLWGDHADVIDDEGGQQVFDRQSGAQFSSSEGFSAGWWTGRNTGWSFTEASFFIEVSAGAQIGSLNGNWAMSHAELRSTDSRPTMRTGAGLITAGAATFDLAGRGYAFNLSAASSPGEFLGTNGTRWFLSHDASVLVGVDTEKSDDSLGLYVGVRSDPDATRASVAGDYRLLANAGGAELDESRTLLRLQRDGTYRIHYLEHNDPEPGSWFESGEWVVEDGVVRVMVDDRFESELTLAVSSSGSNLLPLETTFVFPELGHGHQLGLATRAPIALELAVGRIDPDGRPQTFVRQGEKWESIDLVGSARGQAPAAEDVIDASTWADAADGNARTAVASTRGTYVFTRTRFDAWWGSNLTDSIEGAEPITSALTVFTDNRGVSYIAGTTAGGEMVAYVLRPSTGRWSYLNISADHLDAAGDETPTFVGPLISYVTQWNGLNIAGLDAEGNIRAVWSGDGGGTWRASDLSTITGAPEMSSGLTAYLTSWGGINIVGLDTGGRVVATWWVPSFGGDWRTADLTRASDGPLMTGSSLTSFVAPWGGLNVAGLDADGDVVAYWWSPGTEADGRGWESANLTAAIPDSASRPSAQLQSQTNRNYGGEMNVFGVDPDGGDMLRLFFQVEHGSWQVESLTD